MRHSMTFLEVADEVSRNTWTDWGVVPTRVPVFAPPPVKTKILELPGGDGVIDLTTAITGYPVYGDRQGSISFICPRRWTEWMDLYSHIAEFLHGQYLQVTLEDEPDWYYEGRFSINENACDERHGIFVVDYDLGPYKWCKKASTEPWLWDPFSFVDGVIGNGLYIGNGSSVNPVPTLTDTVEVGTSAVPLTYTTAQTGFAPLKLTFKPTGANVFLNADYDPYTYETFLLTDGESAEIPGLELKNGVWTYGGEPVTVSVTAVGSATLAITGLSVYEGGDCFAHIEVGEDEMELHFWTAAEEREAKQQEPPEEPDGIAPWYATGAAPVTPTFSVSGTHVVALTCTSRTSAAVAIQPGTSYTMSDLVLYKGKWLYAGHAATVTVKISSSDESEDEDPAILSLVFREGRL